MEPENGNFENSKSYPNNFHWIARSVLPALLMFILLVIAFWFYAIPAMRENLIESKREMISELTNTGYALMQHYHTRVIEGELTEEEAKELLKERVRHLRYGPDQSYYFWIIDQQPLLIVHPFNIDLVDRDISEYENPDFRDVVRNMAEISKVNNEGFIEYDWEWMGDPDRIEPKLAFVRLFEPWGWIIGTGVYMKDAKEKISYITRHSNLVFALFGFAGLVFAFIISINGIKTERKLIVAKEKAEESDRLKSAFLANMSHEIRTPMNGILGFADLLKNKNLGLDKQKRYLEIINKSGTRMLNIINDLIDISRIESGEIKVQYQQTDIVQMMNYFDDFFRPETENKGLKLKRSKSDLKNSVITTDGEKLNAVMTNLMKNAIKYTTKGSITYGHKPCSNFMEFWVEDTGPGIPEEKQASVFERFVRVENEYEANPDGAGLGLAISKAYVKMMGGEISVKSETGKGTRFAFSIPLIKAGDKDNPNASGPSS